MSSRYPRSPWIAALIALFMVLGLQARRGALTDVTGTVEPSAAPKGDEERHEPEDREIAAACEGDRRAPRSSRLATRARVLAYAAPAYQEVTLRSSVAPILEPSVLSVRRQR